MTKFTKNIYIFEFFFLKYTKTKGKKLGCNNSRSLLVINLWAEIFMDQRKKLHMIENSKMHKRISRKSWEIKAHTKIHIHY